jgi:hypothetical protein
VEGKIGARSERQELLKEQISDRIVSEDKVYLRNSFGAVIRRERLEKQVFEITLAIARCANGLSFFFY